ncbi:hypothetical protein BaRGS_00014643 [Batillaria attramentaria]|uniref:Uncharacterized protein n=1 Tax=Batillaria attramentaria TaxID=370345 RepID=A0ABD0L4T5_9CAEN
MDASLSSWVDYTVIAVYFFFVMVVGLCSMRRKNRETVQGYFLAGRTMHWIPVGASLFASNIGSEHFVGLAGSGAASGIAVVAFEWGAVPLLILLGWVYLPIYLTSRVFTIPEYLGKRFGGYRMRVYLSCLALTLYVLSKTSVDVYAGGVFIQQATGWNLYLSMIPLLILTGLYTIAGGLAAVVFTDALQTVIMMIGGIVLAIIGKCRLLYLVGGYENLYYKYMEAVPSYLLDATNHTADNVTCGMPRDDAFHIFRDPLTSDLPWPGVMVRATVASLWNWCADQVIVQRALAARNMAHAQGATLLAGLLKLTPLFLMILPGMISRVLYPELVACADPETCMAVCSNPAGCSNIAYPLLILKMAPTGMRGLLMAVMLAALMSSLTSIFNSAGTILTMDLWRKIRPTASQRQLLLVGRVSVVLLVAVSIAWIPLIVGSQKGQLFMYIQAVTGYVAPPICSIAILAVFVPRVNETGAFWGVVAGQVTGVVRLVLDFIYPAPGCGQPDTRPYVVASVHFTYFSIVVLAVTAIVAVVVSLLTPAQDKEKIDGLTWWSLKTRSASDKNLDAEMKRMDGDGDRVVNESPNLTDDKKDVDGESTPNISMETEEMSNFDLKVTQGKEIFDPVVPLPWRRVLDICAIVLLLILAFLLGIFA